MLQSARRFRAIAWIVCAALGAAGGSSARGGLVMQAPSEASATILVASTAAGRAAPVEALEAAPPAVKSTAVHSQQEHIVPIAPAAFADASPSSGAIIPLPATVWTGLVILGALAAVSAVRGFRR